MKLTKNVEEIKKTSEQTLNLLKETNMLLKTTQEKAIKENRELKENLKQIRLNLKSASFVDDTLVVSCSIDPVYLQFDENNEPIENKTLKALNLLNLLSLEDQFKLSELIQNHKKIK